MNRAVSSPRAEPYPLTVGEVGPDLFKHLDDIVRSSWCHMFAKPAAHVRRTQRVNLLIIKKPATFVLSPVSAPPIKHT
jgi:hypothetical protein